MEFDGALNLFLTVVSPEHYPAIKTEKQKIANEVTFNFKSSYISNFTCSFPKTSMYLFT